MATSTNTEYINLFFESLFADCERSIERFLHGPKVSLETFIWERITKWDKKLNEIGYPAMGSEGWLLQVIMGKLLESYISKIVNLSSKPEPTHSGAPDTSYRHEWHLAERKIVLSINTSLHSIDPSFKRIQPDIAVLFYNSRPLAEAFFETKMYLNQSPDRIRNKYLKDLENIGGENVINRLILLYQPKKDTLSKLLPIQVVCLQHDQGTLGQVFKEIGTRLRAYR